jgi:type IV pilus assembly protein PilE
MRNSLHRGFTLVELMITVAIIALLATIALPSYRSYVIRANRSAAKEAMMDIANRQQQFLLANRVYADKATFEANGYALPSDVSTHYTWAMGADPSIAVTRPSYLITFTPTGAQARDGALTLNSQGVKTPAEKWAQ